MSGDPENFFHDEQVRARKPHTCFICRQEIPAGSHLAEK